MNFWKIIPLYDKSDGQGQTENFRQPTSKGNYPTNKVYTSNIFKVIQKC
jgi:hypothetical protein